MKTISKYTTIQKIDRNFRLGFSNVFMLFYPDKRIILSLFQIILILFFFGFMASMIIIAN